MTLDEAKKYLRVDTTADDTLIQSFITAATTYIYGQTGKTLYKGAVISTDELYNLCLKMMLAGWYENRGPEIAGNLTKVSHSVDALICHISICGDYT
jgi:uncharacterized phage protein (predicted DNA packaging)